MANVNAPLLVLRALLLLTIMGSCGQRVDLETELSVYAAASLRDVARELATVFEDRYPARVIYNFAGSNTLAQQILAAEQADIFISADRAWTEVLEKASLTIPGSRQDILSNRLVLIAHKSASWPTSSSIQTLLAANKSYRWLTIADPTAVPAGRYAKDVLHRIGGKGLWNRLAPRIVPTLDVRAALALVELDPAIAGIVYRTDARTSNMVRILYEFPHDTAAPIVYSAVRLRDSSARGRDFLEFLSSDTAQSVIERHGFAGSA